MQGDRDITKAILKAIRRGTNRSPLFWWLVEHHDEVAASADGRIHWKDVCAAAAEFGLTDTRGRPPSERNARETWRQARIAVAKGRERVNADQAGPSRARMPSRLPPVLRDNLDENLRQSG